MHVRTTAPARIFAGLVPPELVSRCDVDAGAEERSPLEVDPAGTLRRIADTLARKDAVVAAEVPVVRQIAPSLIVSDAPFLAGDIAHAAAVPCVAMTNFSWDWIAEPFVSAAGGDPRLVEAVGESYAKMDALLRMPLGGVSAAFRRVIDVPLVANHATRDRAEVLRRLNIRPDDRRKRVLFGVRGAIPTELLARSAASADDLLYLCPTNEPGDVPAGVVATPIGADLDFSDVLQICDVVVGKMGYGLIAECIASGATLLWPRRSGFREDQVVEREGPQVMRMRELPLADFYAGRWNDHVRAAAALPPPPVTIRTDGAEVCAEWIARPAI